ncbi:hypothetical protein [Halobellus limi]|uniref:Uncharacterized protein n=1 Tax=Halobellus limi TaxID=699433 RepID=A0A1H5T280_9EURY|nr:hypothetical protein [Halobellus limi]QCC47441.1 hypothetical protein DV707_07070 [Halobellus limi]SEF56191.1 hypothetical protein SAMN04488133_0132 [Halobellus limi]
MSEQTIYFSGPDDATLSYSNPDDPNLGDTTKFLQEELNMLSRTFSVSNFRDRLTSLSPGVTVRRGGPEGELIARGTETGIEWENAESSSNQEPVDASATVLGSIGPKAVGAVVLLGALALIGGSG